MPLKNDWETGDQFSASDANNVADAVNSAYVKPGDGIPKADLAAAVQVSLGKADTAVQAVSASSISDSTATGRNVLTAADAAAARVAIGVAYGASGGTVCQGNDARLSPSASSITDSTAVGRSLLTATDAASARSAIGVAYGASGGTVCQGNDSRVVGAEQVSNKGASNGYASLDSSGKVPVTQLPTGFSRSITTITSSTTLDSTAGTDYVVIADAPAVGETILRFNGTNGSSTFSDEGQNPTTWTGVGGAALSTAIKKHGTASLALSGSGQYLTGSGANLNFGTGDMTIEAWIYMTNTSGHGSIYDGRNTYNEVAPWLVVVNGVLTYFVSNAARITGGSLSANTWYHVALSRVSGVTRLFLDGTQIGSSYTDANNYITATNVKIGVNVELIYDLFTGYIDSLMVSKSGIYSSNFTAPGEPNPSAGLTVTLPTAVGNTRLYTVISRGGSTLVVGTSSQTVDGQASQSIAAGGRASYVSDSANWVRAQ